MIGTGPRYRQGFMKEIDLSFNTDTQTSGECGGAVRIPACIGDSVATRKNLDQLKKKG